MAKQDITVCIDAYPDTDTDVFRIGAADNILRLLADAHDTEFTIPELVDATGVTRSTVWRAVDLLDSIGAVITASPFLIPDLLSPSASANFTEYFSTLTGNTRIHAHHQTRLSQSLYYLPLLTHFATFQTDIPCIFDPLACRLTDRSVRSTPLYIGEQLFQALKHRYYLFVLTAGTSV
ncbi:hypothetical protein C463_00415 [Halorubrum californiense DSM 19288]|uniref:Helix-turn-helix type 11 domain-containing protein n=1 Tax=Halorubrum californiense DSM 19288 TaxID=1227465 RepID=M0EQ97_9EURY|nr:helix-turn-helix domain-containing protein [Halorubrum californiense]ELZ49057.1 hypothetical protein C463_00415 [Halorubrum californiense DSM 19288]